MDLIDDEGLSVVRLAVDRGGRPVLRDLSFHLPPGCAILVTGGNGAGKSTLLRALAGLIPRHDGEIALRLDATPSGAFSAGETVKPAFVDIPEQAHYLGHANGLKLSLTAGENLRFYAEWGGGHGASPADALDSVGLRHLADIPAGVLSAGQRRRVALARLLVAPRPLWLLDEPATALDAASEGWLARIIRAHLLKGGLALAAIHSPLDVPARELRLGAA